MESSEVLSPLRDRAVSVLGGKSQVCAEILLDTDGEEQYTRGYAPQEGNAITGLIYNEDECLVLRSGFLERHLENAEETTSETELHESRLFKEGSYFGFDTKMPAGPDQRSGGRIQLTDEARTAIVGENEAEKVIIGEQGFSYGFHCWTVECTPLSEVAIGITCLVGVSTLADANPIVLLKRQSDNHSFKFYSKSQSGLPEVHDLISPITNNKTNIVSVSLDFTSQLISFFVDATLIGTLLISDMTGSHTLYCCLRSGSSATLIHELPCCYRPLANVSSTLLASSNLSHNVPAPVLSSAIIAGNPYSRWGSNSGSGTNATFSFPLGLVNDGNGRCYIGDRDIIRIVNTKHNPPTVTNQPIYYISSANAKEVLSADFINVLYFEEVNSIGIITIFDNKNQSLVDVRTTDWTICHVYELGEFFDDPEGGIKVCESLSQVSSYDTANGCFGTTIASTHRSIEVVRSSNELENGMFCFGVQGLSKIGDWRFITIPSLALLVAIPPSEAPYAVLGVRNTRGYSFGWGSSCLLHTPTSVVSYVDKMQRDHHLFVTDTGNNTIVLVRLRYFDNTFDAYSKPLTLKVGLEGTAFTITEIATPFGAQITSEAAGHFLVVAEVEYQRLWKVGPLQVTFAETTEEDLWQYFAKWMLEEVITNSTLRSETFSTYLTSSGVIDDTDAKSRVRSFFIDVIELASQQKQYKFLSSLKQYIPDDIELSEETLAIFDECD